MMLLPAGVVQPFFLRYRRDDFHVMAFMAGHPAYEAVEAMVGRKADGGWAIRAILTRHDQTQVDHINDDLLFAQMQGAERELCRRDIDFHLDRSGERPRARLAFVSAAGEPVVLDLTAAGTADPAGAGLSDPGGHSASSSLPLMWRGASALAAPETFVEIASRRYAPPERFRRVPFIACEGYYTELHAMGVIRAGVARERAVAPTAWPAPGPDGLIRFQRERDTVVARPHGDRLALTSVAVPASDGSGMSLVLAFDEAGDFSLSMESQTGLVTGCVEVAGDVITLTPHQPAWAASRVVRIACVRAEDDVVLTTTVGEASDVESAMT